MVALGAVQWTYWFAPLIVLATVVLMLGLGVAYLVKVVRPQYPPGEFSLSDVIERD